MKSSILQAFRDEMESILGQEKTAAFMADVGNKILTTMRSGWNYGSENPGGGWLGEGMKLEGKGGIGRAYERAITLNGLTRHLPVGPKALTVGFTAASLPGALKKEDPSGQGKSRAERLGSLAGSTIGGIAMAHSIPGSLGAGIAGDYIGGKIGRLVGPRKKAKAAPAMVQTEQPPISNLPQGNNG
jgi:hypothetical protein